MIVLATSDCLKSRMLTLPGASRANACDGLMMRPAAGADKLNRRCIATIKSKEGRPFARAYSSFNEGLAFLLIVPARRRERAIPVCPTPQRRITGRRS